MLLAELHVDPGAFPAIVATAALAGTLAAMLTSRGLLVPNVVPVQPVAVAA